MLYAVLMTAVLVVSFALMVGLVKFSESVIARRGREPTGDAIPAMPGVNDGSGQ
jgi:hypothetical protein